MVTVIEWWIVVKTTPQTVINLKGYVYINIRHFTFKNFFF